MLDNKNQDTTYVGTFDGHFTVEVDAGFEGAKHRVNKNNRDVYYLTYSSLTGIITGLSYRKHDHGGVTYRSLVIVLESEDGVHQLEMDVFSDPALAFFHLMENIDYSIEVKLSISKKEKRTSFFVNQLDFISNEWVGIKWCYTNKHPNGRPAWENRTEKDVDGSEKTTWDKSAQVGWFLKKLAEVIKSMNKGNIAIISNTEESTPKPKDDLPF